MSIAFLVLGLVIALAGLSGDIVFVGRALHNGTSRLEKKEWLPISGSILMASIGVAFLSAAWNTWGGREMTGGHAAMAVSGALLAFAFFMSFWDAFVLHYYKPAYDPEQKRRTKVAMYSSIPLFLIFILLFGEGIANYLTYPLISGILISTSSPYVSFTTPTGSFSGSVHIMWYALFILTGVVICYFVSDHEFYKKYGKHGLLEGLVVVAFLCGIIGARVWYVVGNWTVDGFNSNPWKAFAIWDGGLTVIGGVVFGIAGGVTYLACNKKLRFVSIPWAMGVIIPTILLAQAVGRWGNFFNAEVHGVAVNLSDGWQWLPTWLWKNMQYSSTAASLASSDPIQIYVPLFLIESLVNFAGYFIIRFGIMKPFEKWLADGDGAGMYFIYYGIVRIIMEPYRYGSYNMGESGNFSIYGSAAYIVIGVLLIVGFELWGKVFEPKLKARKAAGGADSGTADAFEDEDDL